MHSPSPKWWVLTTSVRRLGLPAEPGVLVLLLVRLHPGDGLLLRCVREVGRLVGRGIAGLALDWGFARRRGGSLGGCGAAASVTNVALSLSGVIPSILLHSLAIATRMMSGQILHLLGLGIGELGCVREMVVDELLVGLVDQRREVDHGRSDERKTPERRELDEPVRDEGGKESGNRGGDVLGEEYPLELDDEEVDELFDVFERGLESFARDRVVFPWAEGRREAIVEDELAGYF